MILLYKYFRIQFDSMGLDHFFFDFWFRSLKNTAFELKFNLKTKQRNEQTNLPTSAKITVSKGAAGNLTATLNSNICSRSTGNLKQFYYQSFAFLIYNNCFIIVTFSLFPTTFLDEILCIYWRGNLIYYLDMIRPHKIFNFPF